MAKTKDKPHWIWLATACHRENVYLRARRRVVLAAEPVEARLRITAFCRYVLYVNGTYVGCGPAPSSPESPLLDEYTQDALPLKRGANVIAVLAHNPYVGMLRQSRMPGGLWARFEATYKNGKTETAVTGSDWRVAPAGDFSVRAPRIYWTDGFCEIRDTRRTPAGWTEPDFDDRAWAPTDLVAPKRSAEAPVPRPRPRTIARPAERFVEPERIVASGRSEWGPGPTAVPFEFAVPDPAHGEFYAATFVHSHRAQKARLVFDCDESGAVYVNNRLAVRQGYDERFVHWLEFVEHDEYPGLHHGHGHRAGPAEVDLGKGWNSLGVVIYDPCRSWGFALRFEDPGTGKMLPMEYSPDLEMDDLLDWQIILDQLCPCGKGGLPEVFAPNARTFPDPAQELAWEHRTRNRRHPPGAAAMTSDRRGKAPMRLRDGQYVTFDFGREVAGCVALDVTGPAGAIVDLAWAEGLGDDDGLDPAAVGVRRADRFVLDGGRQRLRTVGRRALRYLMATVRVGGKGTVRVHRLGVEESGEGSGADLADAVRTTDRRLTAALALAGRTFRICRQDLLEGAPGRDAEQSLPAAWLLDQASRVLLGECERGEAALRAFADRQEPDGRLYGVAPGGTELTVPDWSLLWVVWLAEYVAWTGRLDLAEDLYPAAERCLEWTAGWRGAAGLLENPTDEPPWWLFLDHSPIVKQGEVTAWQALWVRALRASASLAGWLGRDDEAAAAREEADQVVRIARDRLYDADRSRFVDSRLFARVAREGSAATNYYALWGGLASDEEAEAVLARLGEDPSAGAADWGPRENPYVKYFAAEALLARGRAAEAMALVGDYFARMKKAGFATVPEVFPVPAADAALPEGADGGPYGRRVPWVRCHGTGVYPPALVGRWILGVVPDGPGFETLRLAPMPADLKQVEGRVWTPKGWVEVTMRATKKRRTVRATLPPGLPYRLDRTYLDEADEVDVQGGEEAEGNEE
jgi:hypothetical protein